tara:strand:+ start:419 stop:595 length:177 start_codon:yes stop_codon:yes gene_type:complete
VSRLFEEIGPSFADRNGGYTRLLKLGTRRGDNSEVCLVKLVTEDLASSEETDEEGERA